MARGHFALAEGLEHRAGEDVAHEAGVAVVGEHAVVADDHSAGLLAAMLERVERVIGIEGDGGFARADDAEDAALVVDFGAVGHVAVVVDHRLLSRRFMISS